MDSSYNVIRRFTPPTCTLEILQKISTRYFWQPKQVNEDYQFRLSFDDPRLFEGEAISLSGDQNKLDRLCQVVSTYTEEFLARSFHGSVSSDVFSFQISARELSDDNLLGDGQLNDIDPNLENSQLVDQAPMSEVYSSFALPELVNHHLDLDSVDSEANLSSISLSATQLFDLGSALNDYQEAMIALAQEQKQLQPKQTYIPGVVKALLGLLVVSLGLLGSRLLFRSRLQNQVASHQQEKTISSKPRVGADVIPPKISESTTKLPAKVQESPKLSDRQRLPPPPAVTTPKPPPNIPDPAKFPPPVGSLAAPPLKPLPAQDSATSSPSVSKNSSGQGDSKKLASAKTDLDNTQVEATINIPPQATTHKGSEAGASASKPPSVTVVEPNGQIDKSKAEITRIAPTQESTTQESTTQESTTQESTTSTTNIEELPGQSGSTQLNQLNLKNQRNFENRLRLADQDRADQQNLTNPPENQEEQSALQEKKGIANETKSDLLPPNNNFPSQSSSNDGELVQLQEIDSYFRNKWRSPEELKQTLEYRLILTQDGSIKRIIPIGKAAGIFLDRTNIPLLGEPFVSPFVDQDIVTVRLLLSPDGEVRTFLE